MKISTATRTGFLPLALLALGACDPATNASGQRIVKNVPASVTAIAAPYQDLDAVVLLPEDKCYWYNHVGPVETTLLPLRTRQGRHICIQQEKAAPSA